MKFVTAVVIAALVWLVGLFAFADRVRGLTPAGEPARADGIVALTGPSSERLYAAMRLMEQDKGDRLLVSGVNPEVRREELRALLPGSNRLYDCCVDLGFDAQDTMGNAQEIAAWSRAKGFDSLIVVTSDYHLPRSLLEIRGADRSLRLQGYAVSTPQLDTTRRWREEASGRRMMLEYNKYLAVLVREGVLRLIGDRGSQDERAAPAETVAEATS